MGKKENPVSMVWLDLLVSEVSQETEDPQDHLDQMENLYVQDLKLVILGTLKTPNKCVLSVFLTVLCSIQAREFSEEFIRQVCSDVLRSKFQSLFTVLGLFKVLKKFPDNYKDAFLKGRSILLIYHLFSCRCGNIFPHYRFHTLTSCFLKVSYSLKRGNYCCISG